MNVILILHMIFIHSLKDKHLQKLYTFVPTCIRLKRFPESVICLNSEAKLINEVRCKEKLSIFIIILSCTLTHIYIFKNAKVTF